MPKATGPQLKQRMRNGKPYGQPMPPPILLTGIPIEVHYAFKASCLSNKTTMNAVLRELMESYTKKHPAKDGNFTW